MNGPLQDPSANPVCCVSQASYWLPDFLTQSAWIEHAPFGFWIVSAAQPRTIVELGVHHGFSYFVLCQAVRALDLDARCFAIDSWAGDEHAGFDDNDVYEAVRRHNQHYGSFSHVIRADFVEACAQFEDGSIDLLHIDGCHTYEAVRGDFESWLPKLSQRAVVLFHDTAEYERGFGVYRLWDELRDRYPHFGFTHGHGLGVLGVGENVPAQVRELFDAAASQPASQAIRAIYERLGAFVMTRRGLAERDREVARLTERVRQLEELLESQSSE